LRYLDSDPRTARHGAAYTRGVRSWIVAVGLLAVLAIHAFADPRPPDHTWGVVGVVALQPATRWIVLVLASLLTLPPVSRTGVRLARPAARSVAHALTRVPTWLWIALLVAVAWALRCRVLYGDAEILTDGIDRGLWTYYKEPLGFFAIAVAYRVLHAALGVGPATAIAAVNTLAGALYWAGVARVARSRPFAPGYGWLAWVLLGTAGTVGTFCGLIEKRGLLVAGTLWTLVLLLEAAKERRRSLAAAAAVLGLTVATHLAAVWLGPAAVAAWYVRHREALRGPRGNDGARAAWREAFHCLWVSLLPFGVVAAGMAVAGMRLSGFSLETFGGGDGRMFVPLTHLETAYERFTMFSSAHFTAVANELLLLAPVGITLAALLPLATRRGERQGDPGTPVLLLACAGVLAFVFAYNPDMMVADPSLGVLNEWDLFSLAGVPLTLLGMWSLCVAVVPGEERDALGLSASVVSVVHGIPWLLLNAGIRL
jgi:hypothetical protein